MKVLVATNSGQGDAPGDFVWTVEGELVGIGSMQCCAADRCGCGRSFVGIGSSRATTTALVADLAHLTVDDLRTAVSDWLDRGGWFQALDEPGDADDLIDDYVSEIIRVGRAFPTGTVVGRRGDLIVSRDRLAV